MSVLGKRDKSELKDTESLWRVYIRIPRPDYKRPSISEFEFFHHDEELAKAVYETKIIEELESFFECYFEDDLQEFYKSPLDFLHLFTGDYEKRRSYLFSENYMEVEPILSFGKYNPEPTTEFKSYFDYEYTEVKDDEKIVNRMAIISEYFPKKVKPTPKSAKSVIDKE